MSSNFLLFDLDGVLIKPLGYRKAMIDTIEYFLKQIGFKNVPINENHFATFESIGITSEWDMIPLFILSVIENYLEGSGIQESVNSNQELRSFVNANEVILNDKKIENLIKSFSIYLENGIAPYESIYWKSKQKGNEDIFPLINHYCQWLIGAWLQETRDINQSKTLQIFQNLVLGSQLYSEITEKKPIVETESYLIQFDECLLNKETFTTLSNHLELKNIFSAVITARPSANPNNQKPEISMNYFPEAELAMKRIKLGEIACVGFGAMDLLGSIHGKSGDYFVKPSPLHALTAILHAGGVDLVNALDFAYQYLYKNEKTNIINFFKRFPCPINAYIFEDSIIGIQSLSSVIEKLKCDGIEITLKAFGISTNQNKIDALRKENAFIFPTINEAFSTYMDDYFLSAQ